VSLDWDQDGEKLLRVVIPTRMLATEFTEDDILMNFIGQHDKNNKELWEGDIVKFDPRDHGNFILGVIAYDIRTTSFIVEQLTNTRDFSQTQDELDEEYIYYQKMFPNEKRNSAYDFNELHNWHDVQFYDEMGSRFSYSELEVVGTLYGDPHLITQPDLADKL